MTNPTPIQPLTPTLVSAALTLLNEQLAAALPWLTTYGQGQRLQKVVDTKTVSYPAIYTGGMGSLDYLTLFPDEPLANLGAFSWWDVQNPVKNSLDMGKKGATFGAGLVVWADFRRAYPSPLDWKQYNVWNLAEQVLEVLRTTSTAAQLGPDFEIRDRVEQIYPGLNHNDIQRHFSQMPYGVFRIDCQVIYRNYINC